LDFEHALREENYQADDEQDTASRIADAKAKRRWFRGGKKTRKNRKSRK